MIPGRDCEAFFISTSMAMEYTLWMQKTIDGSTVKDSFSAYGFAVCEIQWPDEETQDVAVREWPGEHGEDAYIPQTGLKLMAYDMDVEFCYKGGVETADAAYTVFRNYLTGIDRSGSELMIYDPYWKRGRQGVRVKKIANLEPLRSNIDEAVSCKVTFRVADPIAEVVAGTDIDGEIISLRVL